MDKHDLHEHGQHCVLELAGALRRVAMTLQTTDWHGRQATDAGGTSR